MTRRPPHGQAGLALVDVMVAVTFMTLATGAIAGLVGIAVRSKMIVAVRSADTETARQTLEWISERLRNAGLNVKPDAQPSLCRDMIVTAVEALRPTPGQLYVAGEIFNRNPIPGDEVIVLGYRLAGGQVVEERSGCGAWAPATSRVSNPRVTVTGLAFRYFERNGAEVAVPAVDVEALRNIRVIQVSITVQGEEGRSGVQTQTFSRLVMLRNPRPDHNNWLPPQESVP
jgi:type II secretory pathway component PulJ